MENWHHKRAQGKFLKLERLWIQYQQYFPARSAGVAVIPTRTKLHGNTQAVGGNYTYVKTAMDDVRSVEEPHSFRTGGLIAGNIATGSNTRLLMTLQVCLML